MNVDTLHYLSPRDMRKNRSDAVHIMYSCQAFSRLGLKVTLVTPQVKRTEYIVSKTDIFDLYGIQQTFDIVELPTRLAENKDNNNDTSSLITRLEKFIKFIQYALKKRKKFDSANLIYSKFFISTVHFILLKKLNLIESNIIFETAFVKNNISHRWILRNCDLIVIGSDKMLEVLTQSFKIHREKCIKTRPRFNVDKPTTTNKLIKKDFRKELQFDDDKKYVLYGGKTGENVKQLEYFIEAAERLPEYNFLMVGINDNARNYYKSRISINIIFVPFLPFSEYQKYLYAADLLVAYYPDNDYNRHYLGPGKAGPYLISGNPALFSDLPSLRNRFSESMAYFVPPDDMDAFVKKIEYILTHPNEAAKKSQTAKSYIEKHTFEKAAEYILNRINCFSVAK
jgi:glycosyltransferase involved in cell wall biosynthesis